MNYKSPPPSPIFPLKPLQRSNKEGEKCIPYAVVRGEIQPVSKSLNILSKQSDIDLKNLSLHNLDGVIQQFAIIEHKKTMSRAGFW